MINLTDIIAVLSTCATQLIGFGIVVVLAVIAMIACGKLEKHKKSMIRSQAGVAILVAFCIAVNLILTGPLSAVMVMISGKGQLTDESKATAEALSQEIAGEGIVLLQNNDDLLPLESGKNLNVFGWASVSPVYGGSGSGALSADAECISLLQGIENGGFTLNTELSDFYTAYCAERPTLMYMSDMGFAFNWTLPEPAADTYPESLIQNAKSFSDTAVVVISRVGGEETDIPTNMSQEEYQENSTEYKDFPNGAHYLELSQTEKDMLDLVCSNFDDVVLIFNGSNAFELGFVEEYSQIKSVIWCPAAGQIGFASLGGILNGTVNPSAKTADTFVYDLTATPNYNNYGSFFYDNMDEHTAAYHGVPTTPSFVNYVEGIYVGYRYYETADDEGIIDYDRVVQYPFGYGLSYTTFTQEMGPIKESNGILTFDVTVTNTGDVAGKDVVEVYCNPPYYNGGIEKSSVNLVAFDKTNLLEPGASQTLTIEIALEDLASFDTYGYGCYVLEAGDYVLSINSDSHTELDSDTYTLDSTVVYDEGNPRSSDEVVAVTRFDNEGYVTYLSRADHFANYDEATAAPVNFSMPEDQKATFLNNANYDPTAYNNPDDVMPTQGVDNGLVLADLRGADYDDPRWESLLDQMTVEEMRQMIGIAYSTMAVESIGKPATTDMDGPMNVKNFSGQSSIGFPCEVMLANTWNQDLADQFGDSFGQMASEIEVTGWLAPAMNTHRSAFEGRNYEYYSEDPFLAGTMAAHVIKNAVTHGVNPFIKHFALNEQDINRNSMLCTWSTEQATREIYLKPFEMAVKEGGTKAVMSSFNYIGTEWAGACDTLLNKVLRDEWGFRGYVVTDYFGDGGNGYLNADQAIRNGGDAMLLFYDTGANMVSDTSATSVNAMRQASKNILYTVANSRVCDPEVLNPGMAAWQILLISADVLIAALVIVLEYLTIRKYKKAADAAK